VVRSDDKTPDRLWFEFYLEPARQPAVA
jgi:hypothetical protein